ncbi:hypothetical protein PybrP1_001976, partial [[Pythium] brassicae (nom. inval.)]
MLAEAALAYEYFVEQAAENQYNITLLTDAQIAQMKVDADECVALARECQAAAMTKSGSPQCADAQVCMVQKLVGPYLQEKRNMYDMRLPCDAAVNPLCYDFSAVTRYLNSERVREFLHVSPSVGEWLTINPNVSAVFASDGDWSMNFHTYVADERAFITHDPLVANAPAVDAGVLR